MNLKLHFTACFFPLQLIMFTLSHFVMRTQIGFSDHAVINMIFLKIIEFNTEVGWENMKGKMKMIILGVKNSRKWNRTRSCSLRTWKWACWVHWQHNTTEGLLRVLLFWGGRGSLETLLGSQEMFHWELFSLSLLSSGFSSVIIGYFPW